MDPKHEPDVEFGVNDCRLDMQESLSDMDPKPEHPVGTPDLASDSRSLWSLWSLWSPNVIL
jgi:hypothetical protein